MAYSSVYPPGQVSLLGQQRALANRSPHVTYVGHEGTRFHLSGPLAPTPGAQNGVVMIGQPTGFSAPFKHLDNQGARQDGITWLDALYDPGEIDFKVEVSGLTAADTRAVIRSWLAAWSPKKVGRLHVFTPEYGEWWARVRTLKSFTDQINSLDTAPGLQRFTWAARNDDSFWQSFDSVADFGMQYVTTQDSFDTNYATSLGPNWAQTYTNPGHGYCVANNGVAQWNTAPWGDDSVNEVINRYAGTGASTATDNQVVSVQYAAPPGVDFENDVFNDIWCRLDSSCQNGIRVRIGQFGVFLDRLVSGVIQNLWWQPYFIPPLWNETFTVICGTNAGPRNIVIRRDGFTLVSYNEAANPVSQIGPSYRGWGFGMKVGPATTSFGNLQQPPAPIARITVADNNTVTQSTLMPLVNRGDQDGWPRYLCYGPGTFTFSDGAVNQGGSPNTITFGPLVEGQIAMITTLPRLRSVTDLSPNQAPQSNSTFQALMDALVSFAINNNTPPLLQQYESEFGVLPPQGNMYSLLNGRFTTPLAPKYDNQPPVVSQIAVSIVNGNALSRVVAAVTPMRKWPL